MQERYIEKKVCAFAKANGWTHRKLQWIGRSGAPDRVFIKNGRVIFVEFKQLGKKPSPNQKIEISVLREAGAEVHVCDDIETGKRILSSFRNTSDLI